MEIIRNGYEIMVEIIRAICEMFINLTEASFEFWATNAEGIIYILCVVFVFLIAPLVATSESKGR